MRIQSSIYISDWPLHNAGQFLKERILSPMSKLFILENFFMQGSKQEVRKVVSL